MSANHPVKPFAARRVSSTALDPEPTAQTDPQPTFQPRVAGLARPSLSKSRTVSPRAAFHVAGQPNRSRIRLLSIEVACARDFATPHLEIASDEATTLGKRTPESSSEHMHGGRSRAIPW